MAFLFNLIDYGIFINIYRFMQIMPICANFVKRFSPLRIIEYADLGFRVSYTDWFDRLSAPIANYYKKDEMQDWLKKSNLNNTRMLAEGDSWWWIYGERSTSKSLIDI